MNQNSFNTAPDKIIYEEAFTGKTKTYGEFHKDIRRGALWLKSNGLKPGQIVSVIGPSCIDYITTVHSVWWAGGVVSLINNSLHETEVAHAVDLIQPSFLVAHDSLYEKIPKIFGLCQNQAISPHVLTIGKPNEQWPSFSAAVLASSGQMLEPHSLKNQDTRTVLCAILLSSGTTGRPKAVMLSHYNLVSAIHQLRADNPANWRPGQREVFFPPLSHVYALYVCMTGVFWLGAYACLMPRFHLETYVRLMQDRRVTLARLVPPIAKLLAESPIVNKYQYPDLEYFSCSAAPLKVSEKLSKAFPHVSLCQNVAYGCTELSGPCVQSGTRDRALPITAAGTLIANMEMKFLEVDGQGESIQGPGEITVRGPNVMMGYKDNLEATNDSIMDGGWYRTGDIGYIDENGFLVVFDRLKDIIKYNGFQVSPLELEEILVQHTLVDEAAVCGVWNETGTTELARAYIVLKNPSNDRWKAASEISQYVSDRVAHYKQLRGGIVFVDSLPKNPTGKVLRRVLRAEASKPDSVPVLAKL
ncbi:acetyl-CoA synthetase-like protein [Thozetella sp. PMI_491]|nr:acetyl-CoA synthetase-like protein [Thozetella sp. PMI_491]